MIKHFLTVENSPTVAALGNASFHLGANRRKKYLDNVVDLWSTPGQEDQFLIAKSQLPATVQIVFEKYFELDANRNPFDKRLCLEYWTHALDLSTKVSTKRDAFYADEFIERYVGMK